MVTVSFIPVYLALTMAWIGLYLRSPKRLRPRGVQLVAYALFGIYLLGVVYFAFTPFIFSASTAHFQINIVPFVETYLMVTQGKTSAWVYNVFGNLALTFPLGIFVPILYKNARCWWATGLAVFVSSLCIESLQLIFTVRLFDVDDLILNTLGGLLGYLVWNYSRRRISQHPKRLDDANGLILTIPGIAGFAGFLGLIIGVAFAATLASV